VIRPVPLCALILLTPNSLPAADPPTPTRQVLYKSVGDVKLHLHVFEPEGHKPSDCRPAIVFFFGGGWRNGNPRQFYPQAAYLAGRGMVRAHATELGVDPDRIAAGGGSAGGQVAAATAVSPAFDAPDEDTKISARPNALVLFNPAYDNGPEGAGYELVKERWRDFSPMHNIQKGMPPALVFLGTNDRIIPVATAKEFQKRMHDVGSRSELMLFEGQPHGFFNFGPSS
jgi:acetyl esterase/lipase